MIHPVDYEPSQDFGDNPTRNLPADSWIIQMFGNYQPDGHTGVDYPCPIETPIRAVASGRVLHVGWFGGTYADNPYWIAPGFAGWCYVIDHGDFVGIYAHGQDNAARVSVGQQVTEGQVIGLSGNTGGSTGPHLHFEVLPNGWIVNSYMYGRINPANIFASIAPQSTTTKPIEEDTLSAAEVKAINAHATAEADRVIDYVGALVVSGYKVGGQQFPGTSKVDITNQRTIRAILAVVQGIAAGGNLTPEQVEAAVKKALAEGTVDVDITVNGKPEVA